MSAPIPEWTPLTGNARLAGVIGHPVSHSLSPRLHGYWLAAHHVDGAYVPLPVTPERFETVIRTLPDLGFVGANLTIPYKERVIPLLDSLSETAKRIGSVNTLCLEEDGALHGHNTDAEGFVASLAEGLGMEDASGIEKLSPALILGAGGAARAIAVALADMGVAEIVFSNRTRERADRLAADLSQIVDTRATEWPPRLSRLAVTRLLINTTSLGMTGQPPLDLSLAGLMPHAVVTDIVYVPLDTPLLREARERGHRTVDGLGMLLHQAKAGFARWFGVEPEVTADLRAFVQAGLNPGGPSTTTRQRTADKPETLDPKTADSNMPDPATPDKD